MHIEVIVVESFSKTNDSDFLVLICPITSSLTFFFFDLNTYIHIKQK